MLLLSLHKAFFFRCKQEIMILLANLWYFSLHFQRSLIHVKVLCIKDISLILYPKMRLWYFFREKRFIRAYICWFFIACVLPSKLPSSLIPFVGNISCSEIALLFTVVSPSRNFFRNFLAKSFVVSIIIVTFAVEFERTEKNGRDEDSN